MVIFAFLFWVNFAWATVPFKFWGRSEEIFIGCENYINSITKFSDKSESSRYWCGKNALETMVGCLVKSGLDLKIAESILQDNCQLNKDDLNATIVNIAYQDFRDNSRQYFAKSGSITEYPVSLNQTDIIESREASFRLYNMKNRAMYFGIVLNLYWLAVFLFAAIANWMVKIFPGLRYSLNGSMASWVRAYFTLPALGRNHRMLSKKLLGLFHFYSPSRMESSIIIAFIFLTVSLSSIGYIPNTNDSTFNPSTRDYVRYMANRSAIMSTTLVPLVFLLSGRNSILQFCTQWDHSTFMLYHRWIGRVCIIGIAIHSIVASISLDLHGLYHDEIKSWYLIWGIVGTVACTTLFIGSFLYFRRYFYETFFILHLILAIIFLIGSWFHLACLGYSFLMTISMTLFLLDRFLRYIRLLYFGFPEATVTLYSGDTLRVEIPCPKYYFSVPGGHCWLTFGRYFWQSHPFSCMESPTKKNTLIFLCGVKSGVTRRIADKVRLTEHKSLRMTVSMEGIYGRAAPTKGHKSVVFIAGGKGFPGIFSEAYALSQNCAEGSKKIKFIWITKDPDSLKCCSEELQELSKTKVESTIYLTRAQEKSQTPVGEGKMGSSRESVDEDSETKKDEFIEEKYPHIQFLYFRPEISDLVATETEECQESIAFVSCGHPAMVDAMRVSVVEILRQTEKRVDYYDQLQGWA